MVKKSKEQNNTLIIILISIIILLSIGIVVLLIHNSLLEEKYDNEHDFYEDFLEKEHLNTDNSKYISQTEALAKVLDELNITRNDIYDLDIELEYKIRYGKNVYEISFNYNRYEYEYFVDATTGSILDSFKSWD